MAASIIVGLALLGTVALVARSGFLNAAAPGEIKISDPATSTQEYSSDSTSETMDLPPEEAQKMRIHVVGRVCSPGVYDLKFGSRVEDAVHAAGGPLSDADLESINLAAKLCDGQQVAIARKGTVPPPSKSALIDGVRAGSITTGGRRSSSASTESRRGAPGPQKLKSPAEGMININTASLDELGRLPGVGPSIAQRIVDYRSQNGRFKAIDELSEVRGIGEKKLEKIRAFVLL
jgi:competence protein ComEA